MNRKLHVEPPKRGTRNPPLPAPPIVHDALRSPGRPLAAATRVAMESRFRHDFSRVRVHTDATAGSSARAVQARAFTVGRDVVFGAGQYAPETTAGRQLLTHELAHVVQQGSATQPGEKELGEPQSAYERQAATVAERGAGPSPLPPAGGGAGALRPGRTVQRSLLGGILGGLGGAALGAGVGFLLGGPLGAVLGGIAGLVGGALLGDRASQRRRSLTSTEVAYAKEIYKDSIDLSRVQIARGSMLSIGAPLTIGNTIYLKQEWGLFKGDTLELTKYGTQTLIHELGHVWQYQNGGLAYIPESLWAQFKGFLKKGSRDAAYNWQEADKAGIPWERWNPEQQASAIEEYNVLLRKSKEKKASVEELALLSKLLPYMQKVWNREGAPGARKAKAPPATPQPAGAPGK